MSYWSDGKFRKTKLELDSNKRDFELRPRRRALARAFLRRGRQPEVSFFTFNLPSHNHIHVAKNLFSIKGG